MSSPVRMENRECLSIKRRVIAKFCASLAFFLIMLPPNRLVRVLQVLSKKTSKAKMKEVERWRTAINSVSVRCAGNGCLQRSVAVVIWGGLCRKTPDWISGVKTAPFIAHAWVEIEGIPVGETMDLDKFQKILFVRGGK